MKKKQFLNFLVFFCVSLLIAGSETLFAAENSYDGDWSGSVSPDYEVSFTVSSNKVTSFDITYRLSCNGGDSWYTLSYSDWNSRSIVDGTFSLSGLGHSFTGTFTSSNTCDGTWRNTTYCDASGTWTATDGSDPVEPPQEDPFVVYIPHITGNFSDWNDYLQADNLGSQSAEFTITLYGVGGTTVYSGTHSVNALTKSLIDLKGDLDNSAQCGKITYSEPDLYFRISQENLNGGGLAEFKLTNELGKSIGFFFTDFSSFFEWKGIALTNFGTTPLQVTLSAIGDGTTYATTTVPIGPNQKLLGLYQDWFPGVTFTQLDIITALSAGQALSGVAISGDTGNTQLLFNSGITTD